MTTNPTLTMRRSGEFKVLPVEGTPHCGVSHTLLDVRYTVVVVCSMESLDHRGFLFDQTNIDKYFQSLKTVSVSCEQFCIQAAEGLWSRITRENGTCQILSLSVTLSPAPYQASMTFDWKEIDQQ